MIRSPLALVASALIGAAALPLSAVDHPQSHLPRVGAQVLVGTSGFEPGVFAEWRLDRPGFTLRPELFLSEDERLGFGGAIMWEAGFISLPDRHAIAVGPRVAFHNSDESGWEVDLMAIWSFDLVPSQRSRHYIEIIVAAGVLEEERSGEDNKAVFGASGGIGYGFQF